MKRRPLFPSPSLLSLFLPRLSGLIVHAGGKCVIKLVGRRGKGGIKEEGKPHGQMGADNLLVQEEGPLTPPPLLALLKKGG